MTNRASEAMRSSSKISSSVLLLFALYIFPIVGNNYRILSYGIIYIVPMIFFVMKHSYIKKHVVLNNYNIINAALIILMILLSVFLPAVRGTDDYGFAWTVLGIVRYFIIYFFLALIVSEVHGEKMAITMFMKYHAISSAIYVVVSIIFYLVPSVTSLWNSFWDFPDTERFIGIYGYTFRHGWSGFSGFRATYSCSISVVFLLYLYFEKNDEFIKQIKTDEFVVLLLLNCLGNMFYGRTGIAVFAIEVILSIVMYHRIRLKLLFKLLFILLLITVSLSFIIKNNVDAGEWFTWMSTPFVQIITTGKTNNYSYNHLVNDMYFLPEFKTTFIGDARYTDPLTGAYYMHTDAGYMRQLLFWGITGSVITYGYVLYVLKNIAKYKQHKFAILLLICFAIYEFKGEIFYEMIPLMIIISYLFEWRKRFSCVDCPQKESKNGK